MCILLFLSEIRILYVSQLMSSLVHHAKAAELPFSYQKIVFLNFYVILHLDNIPNINFSSSMRDGKLPKDCYSCVMPSILADS